MDNFELGNMEFPSSDFALLLFSHLKLIGIDKVDVLQLAKSLTDLYYVNETSLVLSGLMLRETVSHEQILDIDTIMMNAYLFRYVDESNQEILLTDEYITQSVLPKYSRVINDTFKYIASKYHNDIKEINNNKISKRSFIGDLFYRHRGFSRANDKKQP